jgi:hypothetical protein
VPKTSPSFPRLLSCTLPTMLGWCVLRYS